MNQDKKNTIAALGIIIGWFGCLFGGLSLLAVEGCTPLQVAGAVLAFGAIGAFIWFLDRAGQ